MKKIIIISLLFLCAGCIKKEDNPSGINESNTVLESDEINLENIESDKKEYDYSQAVPENEYVDDSFFDDAAFIGDSRIEDMIIYQTLAYSERQVYGATSLDLNKVSYMKAIQLDNGEMGTLIEALAQKSFNKVYIGFGLNEIGWKSEEVFIKKFTELINEVKNVQPSADIYLLGVYPFASNVEGEYGYTTLEKVKWLNKMIADIAYDNQVYWIDAASMIPEEETYLPEEWTSDGYHLNSDGYRAWVEYLKRHTVDWEAKIDEDK